MANDNVTDLRDTIAPKSDQLNADELLSGPVTVFITSVTRGNNEQPVVIHFKGDDGRPYKPCKTMRKLLVAAWGEDGRKWEGRWLKLFQDGEVIFGGVKVGGIRISHASDIPTSISPMLTSGRGKKTCFHLIKLDVPQEILEGRDALLAAHLAGTDALNKAIEALTPRQAKALGDAYIGRLKLLAETNSKKEGA